MLKTKIPPFFKARRDRLMRDSQNETFVFWSGSQTIRNHDSHYPFRVESSFYYLTGYEEPDSFLVLTSAGASKPGESRSILFVREKDRLAESWEGERYGPEGARKIFHMDEAYSNKEFEKRMPELLAESERVYFRWGRAEFMDRMFLSILSAHHKRSGRSGKGLLPVFDPQERVGELRLFKQPEEIEMLKKACEATAAAHRALMSEVRPGMNEAEVEARIEFLFRQGGCRSNAYNSIVAGGPNATRLHYNDNNDFLREGDLLLIDAGGECEYYSADITRTFPVGRRFTSAQARIYDLVLKAQKECVNLARPGSSLGEIHEHARACLTDGLLSLGLMKEPSELDRFYFHGTGHWLGLDTHDAGLYKINGKSRKLEPGMVFTVEPGLYFRAEEEGVPDEYRLIGVRIEDDLVITENGNEVLTRGVPKEREEIEKLRK